MSAYEFHANALGVGGVVSIGGRRVTIPSTACAVLAASGGEGYCFSDGYDANGVAFTRAESRVVGAEIGDGIFYTYADVLITNLTVFDPLNIPRLRIAKMSGHMTSTRNLKMKESQFEVSLSYRGISLDGADHEPILDVDLCNAMTFKDVANTLKRNIPGYAKRFRIPERKLTTALAKVGARVDPTSSFDGTLVRELRAGDGSVTAASGAEVTIPNVGTAVFGEFSFKPGDRRVKLFRLKVQSGGGPRTIFFNAGGGAAAESTGGEEGDVVFGALEGNGTPPTGG